MAGVHPMTRRAFLTGGHRRETGRHRFAANHAIAISSGCLARQGVACMACRDACPQDAISMVPRAGGAFLPEIRTDVCTNCGDCLDVCPVGAITRAAPGEAGHG